MGRGRGQTSDSELQISASLRSRQGSCRCGGRAACEAESHPSARNLKVSLVLTAAPRTGRGCLFPTSACKEAFAATRHP